MAFKTQGHILFIFGIDIGALRKSSFQQFTVCSCMGVMTTGTAILLNSAMDETTGLQFLLNIPETQGILADLFIMALQAKLLFLQLEQAWLRSHMRGMQLEQAWLRSHMRGMTGQAGIPFPDGAVYMPALIRFFLQLTVAKETNFGGCRESEFLVFRAVYFMTVEAEPPFHRGMDRFTFGHIIMALVAECRQVLR